MNVQRWYTCTPVAFKGDHTFFSRDSGLFCKAFQEVGVESKAIMPLPIQDGDLPDLIRTEYKNLESADWWRQQKLDGVLLYAWTASQYTPIAKAIHDSGSKLVIYMDTCAAIYPWQKWWWGTQLRFRIEKQKHGMKFLPYALLSILRAHTIGIAGYAVRRKHIGYADIIGLPIPSAIAAYKNVPFLFSEQSKSRIRLLPCPVASHFKYDGTVPKENVIIAVGRWNEEESKRPRYLIRAIELFFSANQTFRFELFGNTPEFMQAWHRTLPKEIQNRITLHGIVNNQELAKHYQKAKICLCSSLYESTHIVSAEAVCCGCTIVAPPLPSLSALQWYASEDSGTIAQHDTPESFCDAIQKELENWDVGLRLPIQISNHWCKCLHTIATVTKLL